jgi:hypothetical protein
MPTRKNKGPYEDEHPKPESHEEQRGAVDVHRAYLEHRLAGGEPASPEAYRRAIEQFQKLPGAMRTVPPAASPEKPGSEPGAKDEDKGEPK